MAATEFRLMETMELRIDDAPVKLPGAAERGLLAVLLLSPGRTVAASALIDRLWAESTLPADPLNALQLRVSKLRRALAAHGLDVIQRVATGYRADVDPNTVDLHRFASLVAAARELSRSGAAGASLDRYDEALHLWRGDPLADFAGEPWAMVDVARLEQLHIAALTERSEAARGLTRLGTPLWSGHAQAGVAWCDWRDGLLDEAVEKYAQVRAAGEQLGEPTLIATGAEGLARVAFSRNEALEAIVLLRQAAEVRAAATRPAPPHERKELDRLRRRLAADAVVRLGGPSAVHPAETTTAPTT